MIVAPDHVTLSKSGQNVADPLSVIIWGVGIEADKVTEFNERSAAEKELQRFSLQLLP